MARNTHFVCVYLHRSIVCSAWMGNVRSKVMDEVRVAMHEDVCLVGSSSRNLVGRGSAVPSTG